MVGVNMVLAELVKFKHGLYQSCGIECFEGIMLQPYLLQPRFHVAYYIINNNNNDNIIYYISHNSYSINNNNNSYYINSNNSY